MGLYYWIWFPYNMECHQANGGHLQEIWAHETQFSLHRNDMAGDFGLPRLFNNMLAPPERHYPSKVCS